jgi:hypothetical protein
MRRAGLGAVWQQPKQRRNPARRARLEERKQILYLLAPLRAGGITEQVLWLRLVRVVWLGGSVRRLTRKRGHAHERAKAANGVSRHGST